MEEQQLLASEQELEQERRRSIAQLGRVTMVRSFFIFFFLCVGLFCFFLINWAPCFRPEAFIGLFLCFVFPFIYQEFILISIRFVFGIHDASSRCCCLTSSRSLFPPLLLFFLSFTFHFTLS